MMYLLYWLLLFGMVFTDLLFFAQKTVTHSLMFIIGPLIFVLILVLNNFRISVKEPAIKVFVYYLAISFITSILLLLFFAYYSHGNIFAYGKNLLLKSFEAFFSLSLLHFFVLFNLTYILKRLDYSKLKFSIIIIFLFLSIAGIIEYIQPSSLDFFHSFPKQDIRLRLFNMEPSHATLVYFVFASLSFFFTRNKFIKMLFFVTGLLIILLIHSKGFFITLILTTLYLFLRNIKNIKFVIIGALLLLAIGSALVYIIIPSLLIDIEKSTSFSTRSSGLLSSFIVLFLFPLGTGYGTYMFFYPDILTKAYMIINEILVILWGVQLNYVELDNIVSTGENLGAKAGIPIAMVMSGWIAVIFFFALFKRYFNIINKLYIPIEKKMILKFIIIVIFLQLLIGSEYTLLYVIWLPIALLEKLNREVAYET